MRCKCLEVVEASKGLKHVQEQITSVKETTRSRILKENNTQLKDEVNELKQNVATRRNILFTVKWIVVTCVMLCKHICCGLI